MTPIRATFIALLAGCVIGGDRYPRPRDLEPGWLVDRARILAIRPTPPEVRPGDTVAFEVLLPDPDDTIEGVLWLACSPEETTPFGCAVDPSVLDGNPSLDDLRDAGVIGLEPGLPPEWTAPLDALDAVDPADRLEGVQYTVQAVGLPPEPERGAEVDFDTFEIGYKRVIVSEAITPNENPDIAAFTVDGFVVDADVVVEVDPGQPYELGIELTDDAVETYTYVTPDGVVEERVEAPYARWYATDGERLEDTTLYPYLQADWTAPDTPGREGTWWAVVRDRRGGMAWIARHWRTRSP